MNFAPLALYVAALAAYVWHFTRRAPASGRAATTTLVFAALVHTFVIGMQTMEVGHVPIAGATSAISTFVWLLALSYLYTEMTTDERAMGVFILPLLVALQAIPALHPTVEVRSAVLLGGVLIRAVRGAADRLGRTPDGVPLRPGLRHHPAQFRRGQLLPDDEP